MSTGDPLKLVLFDCDGTLVDSQHGIVTAMTSAWRAWGLGDPDPAAVRRVVGLPLVDGIARLLPEAGPDDHGALARLYKQAFFDQRIKGAHEEPLFPGIREAIDTLDREGALLGVATGKSRRGLVATLERHGLLDRFVTLQTSDDGPGKPHPGMVFRALSAVGADGANAVMIGDTTFDIVMARNAGIASVGVVWGYHAPDELTVAGADRIVTHGRDIPAAISHLRAGMR